MLDAAVRDSPAAGDTEVLRTRVQELGRVSTYGARVTRHGTRVTRHGARVTWHGARVT